MGSYTEIFWILSIVVFIGTVQTAPVPRIQISYFEADEHELIGSAPTLPVEPGMSSTLTLPNGLSLTFGQIVALAGDFFGKPSSPIISVDGRVETPQNQTSNRRLRFLAAYDELGVKSLSTIQTMVTNLVRMMNEDKAVRQSGTGTFHTHEEWDEATGGNWVFGYPIVQGTMLQLSVTNFDHFQPQAKEAYLIGHQLAIETAQAAGTAATAAEKISKLMKAYSLDAFAGHFLTDCFSSGHIRTPRVELNQQVSGWNVGNYLSKFMHDEDCKYGLRVKNLRGDTWISYGDGFLLRSGTSRNRQLAEEAMNVSISQVYEAFKHPTRQIDATDVTNLLPFIDPAATNNAPLFQMKNDELHLRSSLTDLQASGTTSDWVGVTTANTLRNGVTKTNSALPAP